MTPGSGQLPQGSFAERLSAALAGQPLGLQRISQRLREMGISCSPSTLSRWSNGRTAPRRSQARRAVAALEALLNVPQGYLTSAAFGEATEPAWHGDDEEKRQADLRAALHRQDADDFGIDLDAADAETIFLHETLEIDAQRRGRSIRVRRILRALDRPVERFLAGHSGVTGPDGERLLRELEPGPGSRLGRVREHPEVGMTVAEIILERPLAPGEVGIVEYTVIPQGGVEEYTTGWHVCDVVHRLPVAEMVLEIIFHPEALPTGLRGAVTRTIGGAGRRGRTLRHDLQLLGSSAIVSGRDIERGGVRIEWTWDEEPTA
ncbi:hypothetical protein JSY14_11320 [Brachybacterium sp. EF45031]|uniref:hypothetical protein n=1 Tax=Brachybacterium sillae TaxID=2810536 RepID=UPI00217DBAD2|nr:hypothetical protein [Brachybacterium sillae]MCS6712579.1 hypothetical protein [Brachybacterium sillae]